MNTAKEFISPESAKQFLQKNISNRSVNHELVNRYARDMQMGEWKLTHQGILLGIDDRVIDGQHRLMAIVKSGIGQWILVTRDSQYFSALDVPVDVGARRTTSFVLGANPQLVAMIGFALRIGKNISMPSPADIQTHIDLFEAPFNTLMKGSKTTKKGITTAAVQLSAVTRIMHGDDAEYISSNFMAMVQDRFTSLDPMPASFYKQIVIDRIKQDHSQTLARGVRAFNPSRKYLSKLQIKDDGFAFDEARQMVIQIFKTDEWK